MINYFAFSGLVNFIVSLFLGGLVFLKGKKTFANRIFALDSLAVAFWALGYFFWQISNNSELALFWCRFLMVGAIFIPVFYFHFVVCFLEEEKKYKKILYLGYALAIFFLISNFTNFFVEKVKPKLFFPFWPVPGTLYLPFLFCWSFFVIFGWYLLIKALKKVKNKIKRQQIKYFLLGTTIGFLCGSTNYPLWYDIPLPPYLNIFVSFYVVITTFAILKYHLFEIQVILLEILIGIIGILLLIQIFTSSTLLWRIINGIIFLLFSIVGYLLILYTFREIKRREEAERLSRAKTEFLAIASHQLRTPLTAIKGYLSMLLEGSYGELSDKIKRTVKNIFDSTERLIRLVNDFLNVSRLETGEIEMNIEETDLKDLIKSVCQEFEFKIKEKGLYLKFKEPIEEIPKISLDKEKIRHVILNLIDNAIKYTSVGGITIEIKKIKNYLRVVIKDTGEGMEKTDLEKIFDSFSRGEAGKKYYTEGAGLGLYVAKKFVEFQKGKIWAESKGKGMGSTFFIELPII